MSVMKDVTNQGKIDEAMSNSLEAELCAARQQAKKMEGVAAMTQAQLLALNAQFDIIADQAALATSSVVGATSDFDHSTSSRLTHQHAVSTAIERTPLTGCTQPSDNSMTQIQEEVRLRYATPQLRRAMDAVTTLRGALASTHAAGKSARKSSHRMETELAHAKEQCRALESSADMLREEL